MVTWLCGVVSHEKTLVCGVGCTARLYEVAVMRELSLVTFDLINRQGLAVELRAGEQLRLDLLDRQGDTEGRRGHQVKLCADTLDCQRALCTVSHVELEAAEVETDVLQTNTIQTGVEGTQHFNKLTVTACSTRCDDDTVKGGMSLPMALHADCKGRRHCSSC